MSALEKTAVLARVASSGLPKRKALGELGVPKSTTTGGSGGRINKDLRMMREEASLPGTEVLLGRSTPFCRQPGRCRS